MNRVQITILVSFAIATSALQAADKPISFTPSKVNASKNREREKLFTSWMKMAAWRLEIATRQAKGEKVLYFECVGIKDEWRGIFVPRVGQETQYVLAISGEKDAALRIAEFLLLGFKPTFIVPRGNYYSFILSKGAGSETEPEALEAIGIGPPVIK